MAVLAILASDFLSRCNHSSPDRRRCTLGNRLEFKRRLTCCGTLFLDLLEPCLHRPIWHMPRKLRRDAAWMHSRSTHTAIAMSAVELDCKKNIRSLRAPISHERRVRCRLKVGVVQIDIAITVSCGGKVHQST